MYVDLPDDTKAMMQSQEGETYESEDEGDYGEASNEGSNFSGDQMAAWQGQDGSFQGADGSFSGDTSFQSQDGSFQGWCLTLYLTDQLRLLWNSVVLLNFILRKIQKLHK